MYFIAIDDEIKFVELNDESSDGDFDDEFDDLSYEELFNDFNDMYEKYMKNLFQRMMFLKRKFLV